MMADGPPSQSFQISTRVGPRWSNIERMRTAVLHNAEAVFGQGDISEVVGTITSELMENAVKYGDWRAPDRIWLKVAVTGGRRSVRIDVECPIDETSDHFQNLHRMLKWIEGFSSPREAYLARMQEIADRGPDGTSGMGLVRMACEGPCTFDARIAEGGGLVVSAIVELIEGAVLDPVD